jgi:hypothetical protein
MDTMKKVKNVEDRANNNFECVAAIPLEHPPLKRI